MADLGDENLDDEFEAIIENSHLQNLGNQYSSFTVEYLVTNIASCSRTIALLTELLQAAFEHFTQGLPEDERPGLTSDQIQYLIAFFDNANKFNHSVIDPQEDEDE